MENMGYDNLDFQKINDVLLGANVNKYNKNPHSYGFIEKAIIFYDDDTAEVIEFTDAGDAKNFYHQMKNNGIDLKDCVRDMKQKSWKTAYKYATQKEKNPKIKKALATAGVIAGVGVIAATAGTVGYKLGNKDDKKITTDSNNNDDLSEAQGYGFYKYDLSTFENFEQYVNEIPDNENSYQKENATNYLNILQKFNQEIILVDETKQLGGLTIEQLIAVDAFSNSNIYTDDDYIKNFGLYDLSNVNTDFKQAATVAGAYLANAEVDGTILADIFKDETVKDFYINALKHQHKILTSETTKEKKQNIKDFEEFMNSVAVDQTSENYIDFSMHPGMSFATTVIVNSLNYNNIKLSSKLVSDIIVIGNEEQQSKLDSICSEANDKLESAKNLIESMEQTLIDNQKIKVYNKNAREKAEFENSEPVLIDLIKADLDTLITEFLCDQNQINDLINKELDKTKQLVTEEDQKIILANGIEISRKLQNSTDAKTSGKSKEQIAIEKQLDKNGVAVVHKENVKITTEEQKKDLIESNPKAVAEAKQELNEKENLISNETKEEQQQAQEIIQKDIVNNYYEGINYVDKVIAYYEANGNVSDIPSELQEAYNNLGSDIFNTSKNTGVTRWDVKNNGTVGGEVTPLPGMENVEASNLSNNSNSNQTIAPDTSQTNNQTIMPDTVTSNVTNELNTNTNTSTTGGEVTFLPGMEDIDISDIGVSPTSLETNSITEADIDAYLNTDEGLQFLQELTTSETEVESSKLIK